MERLEANERASKEDQAEKARLHAKIGTAEAEMKQARQGCLALEIQIKKIELNNDRLKAKP